jgi:hypothetical protein
MRNADTIELGDRIKDRITKVEGIAVGITYWLYGCVRIVIQPEGLKDGKPLDTVCVDAPQCDIVKKAAVKRPEVLKVEDVKQRPHGIRPDTTATSRKTVTRSRSRAL